MTTSSIPEITEEQKKIMKDTIEFIIKRITTDAARFVEASPAKMTNIEMSQLFICFVWNVLTKVVSIINTSSYKSTDVLDCFDEWVSITRKHIEANVNSEAVKEPS